MKYKYALAGVVLALVLIMVASYVGRKPEVVRVGYGGILSGKLSQMGVESKRGFQIAVDEVNRKGGVLGKKIQPFYYNYEGNPDKGEAIAQNLIEDKVDFVVGFDLSISKPVIEKIETLHKTLFVSPTITSWYMTGKDDYFLRVLPDTSEEATTLTDLVKGDGGLKVAVVQEVLNKNYSQPIIDVIKAESKAKGLEVTGVYTYNTEKDSLNTIVDQIDKSGADAVILVAPYLDVAEISQKLQIEANTAKRYACVWAATKTLIESGGASVENLKIINFWDEKSQVPTYLAFSKLHNELYSNELSYSTVSGYEAAMVLFQGMEKANSLDVDKVKAAIIEIKHFKGLQTDFEIDQFGDSKRKMMSFIIKDGQYTLIK